MVQDQLRQKVKEPIWKITKSKKKEEEKISFQIPVHKNL
jgi:hypothetical protein